MAVKRILIIPQYNEAGTIVGVLERAAWFVDEIVIIDDGSYDGSGLLIRLWAMEKARVVILTLKRNQGVSGALLVGFAYAARRLAAGELSPDDIIVNIDADGQHLPEEIPEALAALTDENADVLLGRRNLSGYPWFKVVGNWGLSLWASLLSGYRYYDVECGFRLMRAAVIPDLLQYFTGRRYSGSQEIGIITARRGWKIVHTFPTQVAYYRRGTRVRDGVTNLVMGFISWLRVIMHLRYRLPRRIDSILADVNQWQHSWEVPIQ